MADEGHGGAAFNNCLDRLKSIDAIPGLHFIVISIGLSRKQGAAVTNRGQAIGHDWLFDCKRRFIE